MYIKAPNGDQRYKEGGAPSIEIKKATNLITIRAIHLRGRKDYQREQVVTSPPYQALCICCTCPIDDLAGLSLGD